MDGQDSGDCATGTGRVRDVPASKDAMSGYAVAVPLDVDVGALRAAVAAALASRHTTRAGPRPGGLAARAGPPAGSSTPREPGPAETGTAGAADSWQLVRAAQAGDVEAFGRLYDRYVDLVFRYVWHRLGDRALAEDVTSETFLRALRRIGSISYRGSDVAAWFVTIARNLVIDHLKSARHRREVVTGEIPEGDQLAAGPEPEVLRRTTNAELLRCVRQLAAEQQECIVLRFLNGLSVTETAQVMGRTEGAVKALQRRAVRRLAELLPEELR